MLAKTKFEFISDLIFWQKWLQSRLCSVLLPTRSFFYIGQIHILLCLHSTPSYSFQCFLSPSALFAAFPNKILEKWAYTNRNPKPLSPFCRYRNFAWLLCRQRYTECHVTKKSVQCCLLSVPTHLLCGQHCTEYHAVKRQHFSQNKEKWYCYFVSLHNWNLCSAPIQSSWWAF